MSRQDIETKLTQWFQVKMPHAQSVAITELDKPAMGLSSETLLLRVRWDEGGAERSRGLVLRAAPLEHKVFPNYEVSHQFWVMKTLAPRNIPVPRMIWLEQDPSIIGSEFYVMERVEGVIPQDYPSYHSSGIFFDSSPELRAKMWWGTVEQMAKIHALAWRQLDLSFLGVPRSAAEAIDRQIASWERHLTWVKDLPGEAHPTIEAALRWLNNHRYEPEYVALCWGDARMGNTVYEKDTFEVVAVVDWEMAFIGDPENDLAWKFMLDWQQSAGAGAVRCPGTPSYEETLDRYAAITGRKIKNMFFNEVFAAVRFGIVLVAVLKKFTKQGIPIDEDMLLNNICTQRLSEMLDLPSPGRKRTVAADLSDMTVTIQFHFTGQNGHDWYLLYDKGQGSRHGGTTVDPDCTIEASADDWRRLQCGDLDRLEAWKNGRLITSGDMNLMTQLEDMIDEFSKTG